MNDAPLSPRPSRNLRTISLLGLISALIPFFGIPSSAKTTLTFAIGIAIFSVALSSESGAVVKKILSYSHPRLRPQRKEQHGAGGLETIHNVEAAKNVAAMATFDTLEAAVTETVGVHPTAHIEAAHVIPHGTGLGHMEHAHTTPATTPSSPAIAITHTKPRAPRKRRVDTVGTGAHPTIASTAAPTNDTPSYPERPHTSTPSSTTTNRRMRI